MHPYSIDSRERKTVPFYLSALAIALAWAFYSSMTALTINLPWWINAPSVLGFYEILFLLFENYGWKIEVLRVIGGIRTPNISGDWAGKIKSSFDSTEKDVTVKIAQTWTQMEVCLKTDGSTSRSNGAFFAGTPPSGPTLTYQYQNDPLPGTVQSMQIHYGTTKVLLAGDKFEGDYYSGRGRQNNGEILLRKKIRSDKNK
ncbi:MAG TPA: hypothetical protein VIJ29_03330 [Candidatus Paceibacterota bacterium]